jgi:hypothetical protein
MQTAKKNSELIRVNSSRSIWCDFEIDRFNQSTQAKELFMIPANATARLPNSAKKHMISDCGAPPMPQQDPAGSHDHEMHPQKCVQLVGCHDQMAGKHEGADRLH